MPSRDFCRSPSRDCYISPSKSSKWSSTPHCNTHYSSDYLNMLYFDSLDTPFILKKRHSRNGYSPRCPDNVLYNPSFQDQFITIDSKSQYGYRHPSIHNSPSHFKKMFLYKISSHSMLTKDKLLPTEKTWKGQYGYLPDVLWTKYKRCTTHNNRQITPHKIYVFKDTMCPLTLISYAASDKLGILHFNVSNETTSTQKRCNHNTAEAMKTHYIQCNKPHNLPFQDHQSQDKCLQTHHYATFWDHNIETPENNTSQALIEDQCSRAQHWCS